MRRSLLFATLCSSLFAVDFPAVPPPGTLRTPYRLELVASQLEVPWSLVLLPDGRLIFTERPGRVRLIDAAGQLRAEPLLSLEVALGNKMGLLGLVADPNFSRNSWLYLAYDYVNAASDTGQSMRVVRYRLEGDRALVEPLVLLDGLPAHRNHTGCRLRFGPDGKLYLTSGDANIAPAAQDLASLRGKIIRLNPDGTVPTDNPFVGRANARPEIWSYGHRNPQGLDFQPGAGRLLAAEHGPSGGDEINWIRPGANYGWPVIDHRRAQIGMESPLLEYTPSVAPAELIFYRGTAFPELQGHALVACLRGEGLLDIALEGETPTAVSRLFHRQFGRIRALALSPEGYLYFSTSQLDPAEGKPRPGYDLIVRLVPAAVPSGPYPPLRLMPPPPEAALVEPAVLASTRNGALLARGHCAPCHGPALEMLAARRGPSGFWPSAPDEAALRRLITEGNLMTGMPAFAPQLDPAQLDALVAYLATLKAAPEPEAFRPATPVQATDAP